MSPVLGRNFLADETRPRAPDVALSYGLWLSHYGRDPGTLNKTIAIDGSPVRVIGVLPRNWEMPRLQAVDVVFPMTVDEAADRTANGGYGGPRRAFARLKPGVTVQQAQAEIEPLFQQDLKSVPAELRYDVHLKIRSLRERQMQDARAAAWVLLAAVGVMLLIACANVASLLMARGASRGRELAVRSALGASRARLVRQALTEAMMLSIAGALAGCALAEGLLHLFIAIAPPGIPYLDKTGLDCASSASLASIDCVRRIVWPGAVVAEVESRGAQWTPHTRFPCDTASMVGGYANCRQHGLTCRSSAVVAKLPQSREPAPRDARGFHLNGQRYFGRTQLSHSAKHDDVLSAIGATPSVRSRSQSRGNYRFAAPALRAQQDTF